MKLNALDYAYPDFIYRSRPIWAGIEKRKMTKIAYSIDDQIQNGLMLGIATIGASIEVRTLSNCNTLMAKKT